MFFFFNFQQKLKISQVVDYFASLGLYAPPHYNSADFMCMYTSLLFSLPFTHTFYILPLYLYYTDDTVELVTSTEKIKDGRTVRQYLIDSWKEKDEEKEKAPVEYPILSEKEARKQMKIATKYPTPWHLQVTLVFFTHRSATTDKSVLRPGLCHDVESIQTKKRNLTDLA